jgi:hypothetical protein
MASHSRLTIIGPDQLPNEPAGKVRKLPARALRPMATVRRIALIEREVRERLSKAALDVIFSRAKVIAEGERDTTGGRNLFVGSAMLTCDIADVANILREPADVGTANRLAALLAKDPSLVERSLEIAKREVGRVAGQPPRNVRGETRLRVQGTKVFIDIDVEATL